MQIHTIVGSKAETCAQALHGRYGQSSPDPCDVIVVLGSNVPLLHAMRTR